MRRFKLFNVVIAIHHSGSAASAAPVHLRCEYLENPLGIDTASPHLSWQSDNTERNWKQAAYEILVASDERTARPAKPTSGTAARSIPRSPLESLIAARTGIATEILLESSCMGRGRASLGVGGSSLVGDGPAPTTDWKAKWIRWKNPEDDADRREFAGFGCPVRMHWRLCPKHGHFSRHLQSFRETSERRGLVTCDAGRLRRQGKRS